MHSLRPWAISMFSVGSVIWCLIAVSLGILTQLNATDAVTEELTCKSSGYCSLGNTKFFTGEINSSSGLKSALDAVSYKKEIVIVTINGEYHVEMLLQLRQDFEDLGMSHFLVLSITEAHCKSVQSIKADASCVWDSSIQHPQSWSTMGGAYLWHLRWRFIARASRMGYNVMSLDSDSHVYQDPYVYLKGYPLENATLISVPESDCGMNGGFAYVQNARPDGPVTWLFRYVTELPLRWMDDDYEALSLWGRQKKGGPQILTFDQNFLDDALHSTITGYPSWRRVVEACAPDDAGWKSPGENGCSKKECMDRQGAMVNCRGHTKTMTYAPHESVWPLPHPPSKFNLVPTIILKVPNSNSSNYPEHLGGRYFSEKGGLYSQCFLDQLNGDCPPALCAWWPDTDIADREKAHSIRETFVFAPSWFWSSAYQVRSGLATPIDGKRPRQVAVHAHAPPGTSRNSKLAMRKIYNKFHYDLSRKLHKSGQLSGAGPYFMNQVSTQPPTRVLVLHPSVDLSLTANHLEMKMIVQGMVQLALLSNRTLVYPDVACEAGWMHEKGRTPGACDGSTGMSTTNRELFPYAALKRPWEGLDGERSWRYIQPFLYETECFFSNMAHFTGMMNPEYEQWWLHKDCPAGTKKAPEAANTLFMAGDGKLKDMSKPAPWSIGEVIVTISPSDALTEFKRVEAEPVVYVGHPTTVDVSAEQTVEVLKRSSGDKVDWRIPLADTFRHCRGLYRIPWDYSRKNSGVIADAARGLPAEVNSEHQLNLKSGAAFADGATKPWKESELDPKFV